MLRLILKLGWWLSIYEYLCFSSGPTPLTIPAPRGLQHPLPTSTGIYPHTKMHTLTQNQWLVNFARFSVSRTGVFINTELWGVVLTVLSVLRQHTASVLGFGSGHLLCCLFKSLQREKKKKAAARGFKGEQQGISYSANRSRVSPIVRRTIETVEVNRCY